MSDSPPTTTAAPPLVRLIGETWGGLRHPDCAITLLGRASLVSLLTHWRPRLGFDVFTPNSGLLLSRSIVGYLVVPANLMIFDHLGWSPSDKVSSRPSHFLFRVRYFRTTSVLAEMGVTFPKGVRRFLLVTMRRLYLAGLLRL